MKVRVRLFAIARQAAGCDWAELDLPAGATIGLVRSRLAEEFPILANLTPAMMFAIGTQYADDSAVVPQGADVACIPPVSGG